MAYSRSGRTAEMIAAMPKAAKALQGIHQCNQSGGICMKVQDHSLMDPDIQENPFAYYDALLSQAPVYFMPEIQAYVISKYKDIQYVVAHPEIWSIDMRSLPAAQLIKHPAAQKIL